MVGGVGNYIVALFLGYRFVPGFMSDVKTEAVFA
jgi:hypothetical protein